MREFETGATRDTDEGKPDFIGYLSPLVLSRYGEYMLKHQMQTNGEMRASDNWKKGMPKAEYLKSMFRHLLDVWLEDEGHESRDGLEEALCAIIFNASGYLHEHLKEIEATADDEIVDLLARLGIYGACPDGPCVVDDVFVVGIDLADGPDHLVEFHRAPKETSDE